MCPIKLLCSPPAAQLTQLDARLESVILYLQIHLAGPTKWVAGGFANGVAREIPSVLALPIQQLWPARMRAFHLCARLRNPPWCAAGRASGGSKP